MTLCCYLTPCSKFTCALFHFVDFVLYFFVVFMFVILTLCLICVLFGACGSIKLVIDWSLLRGTQQMFGFWRVDICFTMIQGHKEWPGLSTFTHLQRKDLSRSQSSIKSHLRVGASRLVQTSPDSGKVCAVSQQKWEAWQEVWCRHGFIDEPRVCNKTSSDMQSSSQTNISPAATI